jgi:hypothetical protein
MRARNQYLSTSREGYLKAGKPQKGLLLDEHKAPMEGTNGGGTNGGRPKLYY